MIRLNETIEVSQTREKCFAYIADLSSLSEWDPQILSSKRVTNGAIGKGQKFEVVAKLGPISVPVSYELTEYDAPNTLVFVGTANGFKAIDRIQFKSLDGSEDGGTLIEYQADFEFAGANGVASPLFRAWLKRAGRSAMQGMRRSLDQVAAQTESGSWMARQLDQFSDRLVLPSMLGFSAIGYHLRQRYFPPLDQRIDDKVVVLTGATSGLGEATAHGLADLGARLLIVGRDERKLAKLQQQLQMRTGRKDCSIFVGDLSELSDVKRVCRELSSHGSTIDVLIHNAGCLEREFVANSGGIERSIAVNLVAPYVMTDLLQPLIKRAKPGRVIFVSSGGMYPARLDVKALQVGAKAFNGVTAYAQAKRAQVVLAEILAEESDIKEMVVHSMHPGWADTPGVVRSLPKFHALTKPILRDAEQGADTIVWLSASRVGGLTTGKFWHDRQARRTDLIPGKQTSKQVRQQLMSFLQKFATEP